jgi:hypothetical protein
MIGQDLTCVADAGIALVFDAKPNDHIRVVLAHEASWRPIFWLRLGRDDSIYLGAALREDHDTAPGLEGSLDRAV